MNTVGNYSIPEIFGRYSHHRPVYGGAFSGFSEALQEMSHGSLSAEIIETTPTHHHAPLTVSLERATDKRKSRPRFNVDGKQVGTLQLAPNDLNSRSINRGGEDRSLGGEVVPVAFLVPVALWGGF